MVTSRGGNEKKSHYALLCHSSENIADNGDLGVFDATRARNLASSNPIGASQVISIVRYTSSDLPSSMNPYRIAFRAKLWAEGFVRLSSPVILTGTLLDLYRETCQANSVDDWRVGASRVRELARQLIKRHNSESEININDYQSQFQF